MIKRNPATFVVSVIVHDNYRIHIIGKGDYMVIHGLGKTRMYGSTVQVAEDFMNITETVTGTHLPVRQADSGRIHRQRH